VNYNPGCLYISDGKNATADAGNHGNLVISDCVGIGGGNAVVGIANGDNIEVTRMRAFTSGLLPNGKTNRGTNVGIYVFIQDQGRVANLYMHDNDSLCIDREGTNNKPNPGDGYVNNAYDFHDGRVNGNDVTTNNRTIPGTDALTFQAELDEHTAWHSARYQAGTVIGAIGT